MKNMKSKIINFFMKINSKTKLILAISFALILLSIAILAHRSVSEENEEQINNQVEISEDGTTIKFPENSSSLALLKTLAIKNGETTTRIIAPARVVMSVTQNNQSSISILFESSEITSLYSQYRQSRASLDRARKNFDRVRDMFNNQLATSRDYSDAEGEFLSAQAIYGEFDGKLRAEGFNPSEFSNVKAGTTLVIADVPESQLEETKIGEQVNVTLSSFQEKIFSGKVVAIGDVIDPVTRTVKVRVALKGDNKIIRPGMFGKVDFGSSQNSVNIPLSAIVTVEEQNYVFVALSESEFERRAVAILNNDSTDAIILSGLSEGENVVVSGAMLLKGLSFGY